MEQSEIFYIGRIFDDTPSRKITETDLVNFANHFLFCTLKDRDQEAHITQLLGIMDGLTRQSTDFMSAWETFRRNCGFKGGASLGWSNMKIFNKAKVGDILSLKIEFKSSRQSKSRPGMILSTFKKVLINQNNEKILEVENISGFW